MGATIGHLWDFANCNVGDNIESVAFMNKRTLSPAAPTPALLEWKKMKSALCVCGADGNENAHVQAVHKSYSAPVPNDPPIPTLLGVNEHMTRGHYIAAAAYYEGCSYAPNKIIVIPPRYHRHYALFQQESRRSEGTK
jgi:hypothetical protein